eukprot:SAG31_NODE_472_length_15237_cov_3.424891_5_plen_817_part_00
MTPDISELIGSTKSTETWAAECSRRAQPFVGSAATAQNRASVESSVFSSVSSLDPSSPSRRAMADDGSGGTTTSNGDLFRDFNRVAVYSEIPPRLRQKSQLELLPDELVLTSLLSWLGPEDLCRFGSACRQLWKWSLDNRLWKMICVRQWGSNFLGNKRPSGVKDSAWKVYYVERVLAHRSSVTTAALSLERPQLTTDSQAKEKTDCNGRGRNAIPDRDSRPARGQLAAACVYMPKPFEDARTMEMVRVENFGTPLGHTDSEMGINAGSGTNTARADATKPPKQAGSGRKRRGRRGRGLGGSSEGVDTLKQRQASEQAQAPVPPAARPSPPPKGASQGLTAARSGRYTQSPVGGHGNSSPAMAPSPPLSERRPQLQSRTDSKDSPTMKLTSRGHGLHPLKSVATGAGGSTKGAAVRGKQPTPPPGAAARRPELNLRAFGTFEDDSPAKEAFAFSQDSPYASCVTPTRQLEGLSDDDLSADEDSADEGATMLSHPAYDGRHGGFVASGRRDINTARLRAEAFNPAVRTQSPATAARLELAAQQNRDALASGVQHQAVAGTCTQTAQEGMCPWHPDQPLDSLCISCNTMICSHCCLFGTHGGHPRISAEEAYAEALSKLGRPFEDQLVQLAGKCNAFEARLDDEQKRVAKARAAMKKSVRTSIKHLRDQLNAQQNVLMEVIREEDESKQAHLGHLAAQLQGVREGLAAAKAKVSDVAPQLAATPPGSKPSGKFNCNRPAALQQARALIDAANGSKLKLDQLVSDGLGALPQIADFSELEASLDERSVREAIAALSFGPTALSMPGSKAGSGRYTGLRG